MFEKGRLVLGDAEMSSDEGDLMFVAVIQGKNKQLTDSAVDAKMIVWGDYFDPQQHDTYAVKLNGPSAKLTTVLFSKEKNIYRHVYIKWIFSSHINMRKE